MNRNSKLKIAVALSGGVDSAVAAKILKDEGHEVIGLFLKLWKYDGDDENEKKAKEVADYLEIPFFSVDVKEKFRDIVVENFVNEYKSCRTPNPCVICNPEVKFMMLLEKAQEFGCDKVATGHYARIENASILNNQYSIINKSLNNQFSITNEIPNSNIQKNKCHSERSDNEVEESQYRVSGSKNNSEDSSCLPAGTAVPQNDNYLSCIKNTIGKDLREYKLLVGVDDSKDQSYMLYRLNQDQLAKIIFPLGEMTKKEVRAKAVEWNLPVKEKAESQEICFFGDSDYRKFLRRYLPAEYFKVGDIVDVAGNVVGRHEGLVNYTIGQRKGVDQKLKNRKTEEQKNITKEVTTPTGQGISANKQPMYVIGFDIENNRLIVGENQEIFQEEMIVGNTHWIVPKTTSYSLLATNCTVKIRSQAKKVSCKIQLENQGTKEQKNKKSHSGLDPESIGQNIEDSIRVIFDEPQRAVTPGQSAVFYDGDEVLGGGVIN